MLADASFGKIYPLPRLIAILEPYRPAMRIAVATGCFDILHPGHLGLFTEASMLADILIVGVNGEISIRRLKGPGRPIFGTLHRMRMLAGLHSVDYVTNFDEETPAELLEALKPDVYVKGGDYRLEDLPETAIVTAYGGLVEIVKRHGACSTTEILKHIRGT